MGCGSSLAFNTEKYLQKLNFVTFGTVTLSHSVLLYCQQCENKLKNMLFLLLVQYTLCCVYVGNHGHSTNLKSVLRGK
jgi:hypothetical protein